MKELAQYKFNNDIFEKTMVKEAIDEMHPGMGLNVLSESYLPAFVSDKNVKSDLRSDSWFEFYKHIMLKGGDFNPNSMERDIDSLKEVLKQKMLNHEAIFRVQVNELHRLYRIQKNLMEDLNWSNKYAAEMTTSQFPTFPFQMTSVCMREETIYPMPWLYKIDKATQLSKFVKGANHMQAPTVLPKQNAWQMNPTQIENKDILEECGSVDSKCYKIRQRSLNLQLVADEYIDSAGIELVDGGNLRTSVSECLETKNFLTSNIVVDPEEVKLTLSTGGIAIKKSRCSSLHNQNIIDLEKSPEWICNEAATISSFIDLEASVSSVGEKHCLQTPAQSNPTLLGRSGKDSKCIPICNHSLAAQSGNCQEWRSAKLDAGQREHRGNPFIDVFAQKQQPDSYASMHVDLNGIRKVQLENGHASMQSLKFSGNDQHQIGAGTTVLESVSHTGVTELHENSGNEVLYHNNLNKGLRLGLCGSLSFSSTCLDKSSSMEHEPKVQGLGKFSKISVSWDTVTEGAMDLTLGLSSGFIHSDIRGGAKAVGSTDRIDYLKSSLGNTIFPQPEGGEVAGQVPIEKSEEDTLSSSLTENCVIVQASISQPLEEKAARNCRDLPKPVGNKPNSIDESNACNIKDLESTTEDGSELGQANLSALEPLQTSHLEPFVNEICLDEPSSVAETGDLAILQEKSNQEQALEMESADTAIRTAAESLLLISSENSKSSLDWFSETVYLNARSREKLCEDKCEQPQSSSESYEEIALMLTETSMDENSMPAKLSDEKVTEEIPCGLKLRRGRRIRDFQREILPSLISLSRYEVAEDMYGIRGMIKARARELKNRSRQTCREDRCLPIRSRRSRLVITGRRS